jgi:hypothetical protein
MIRGIVTPVAATLVIRALNIVGGRASFAGLRLRRAYIVQAVPAGAHAVREAASAVGHARAVKKGSPNIICGVPRRTADRPRTGKTHWPAACLCGNRSVLRSDNKCLTFRRQHTFTSIGGVRMRVI